MGMAGGSFEKLTGGMPAPILCVPFEPFFIAIFSLDKTVTLLRPGQPTGQQAQKPPAARLAAGSFW
jgi:hypothetical protein